MRRGGRRQLTDVIDGDLADAAFGLLGFSDTVWGGVPLPVDLGFLGSPGCILRVSPEFGFSLFASPSGIATWGLAIPGDTSLSGLVFFQQGMQVDFATARFVLSNVGRGTIGV